MSYNVEKYLRRNNIQPENIQYLHRDNPHTIIGMFDGQQISTTFPLKELMSHLPQDEFINASKGISLRKNQIVHISDDGVYTMTDGRSFQGRKRTLKAHKDIRDALNLSYPAGNESYSAPLGLIEKCTLMDDMPLAFCVIELVFDADGHGVDFVFRYCNKEMANVEGIPVEDMLNRSFYEIFKNGDKKWLVTYADVALNGTKRTIEDFSPEVDKALTIYCYQPCEGHCACILIPN